MRRWLLLFATLALCAWCLMGAPRTWITAAGDIHWQSVVSYVPFGIAYVLLAALFVGGAFPAGQITRGFIVAAFTAAGYLGVRFGLRQFGSYDLSLLVDVGWRGLQGQRAFKDFPFTLPPTFATGATHAFQLLGFQWKALCLFNWLFASAAGIGAWLTLRRDRHDDKLLLFAVATAFMIPVWITGHWWHSSVSSIGAALWILVTLGLLRHPESRTRAATFVVTMALTLGLKPNVAAPVVVGVLASMMLAPQRKYFLKLALGGALVFVAWMSLEHISPLRLLAAYRAIARERAGANFFITPDLTGWFATVQAISALAIVAPLVAAVPYFGRRRDLSGSAPFGVVLAGLAGAFFGLKTNWDIKQNDYPLLVTSVACGLHLALPHAHSLVRYVCRFGLVLACAFLTVTALGLGQSRWRNQLVDDLYGVDLPPLEQGFFKDFSPSPRMAGVLKETERALAQRQPNDTVFFGPRVEFLYAAYQVPSPKHLPLWWHPGASYPRRSEKRIIEAFRKHAFNWLVFLHGPNFTRTPPALAKIVLGPEYRPVPGYEFIQVYERVAHP